MPYRRKRRNRNKYFGFFFFITVLWMMGLRVNLEKILGPTGPQYIKVLVSDGKVYRGIKTYESSDALSILSQDRRLTFMAGEVLGKETLTGPELRRAIQIGEIHPSPQRPLITFDMQDNFFYNAFNQLSSRSMRREASASGMAALASKVTGVPQSKIQKALKDPEALKKKLSPDQIEKYTRMAREKGISV